jgi:outer membrane protein assembly factor BamB
MRPGRHPSLVQGGDPTSAGEVPLGGARLEAEDSKNITFVVAALDAGDGNLVWEHELEAEEPFPEVHEKSNMASPSPVTDGDRVYAWFSTGQLVALGMDGEPVWERHLGQDYSVFDISWGHGSSPALHDDLLILICFHNSASYLLALDKRTGEQVWKTDREEQATSYSTPAVVNGPNGDEIIVNCSDGVEGYSAATGEKLWSFTEANRFPIPAPVHSNGTVYLTRGYRSGPYMALKTGGKGEIKNTHVNWRVDTGAPYVSSLIQYEGLIYMANGLGIVTCVDAETGERVWQERLGGVYSATPVAADGKIYFFSESGDGLVLKAGRQAQVLARNELSEHIIASPAIAGGKLFIRSDRNLIAIGGSE